MKISLKLKIKIDFITSNTIVVSFYKIEYDLALISRERVEVLEILFTLTCT